MASSERRVASNRANARRSTGPRTEAGKRRSARNAVVHGLTARSALLHGDDPVEFNRLARRTVDELDPAGPIEEQLVAEIINHTWKLRRVPAAEVMLFDEHHGRVPRKREPDEEDDVEAFRRFLDISQSFKPEPVEKVDLTPAQSLSHMVQSKSWSRGTPNSPVWNLERYAARIERARGAALRLLLTLQKRRQAREEEAEEEVVGAVDDEVVDGRSPAARLEGTPVAAPAAGKEPSVDPAGADRIGESTSTLQNEPNESSTDDNAEVTVSNGVAVQGTSGIFPGVRGSKPTAQPLPDMTTPVEPGPSIGESPPPTT
jgi:hypothetical protein